jgi:hypothetical protein
MILYNTTKYLNKHLNMNFEYESVKIFIPSSVSEIASNYIFLIAI